MKRMWMALLGVWLVLALAWAPTLHPVHAQGTGTAETGTGRWYEGARQVFPPHVDAAGNRTTGQGSTAEYKDANGKVTKTRVKRSKVTRGPDGKVKRLERTTEETIIDPATGKPISKTTKTTVYEGDKTTKNEEELKYDGDKATEGKRWEIIEDGKKGERRSNSSEWDPNKGEWKPWVGEGVSELKTAANPTMHVPEDASAGGMIVGTVETEANAMAAGVVEATSADGRKQTVLADDEGRFVLPSESLVQGLLKLAVRDLAGRVIAERTLQVGPAVTGDPGAAPQVSLPSSIMAIGSIGRLLGTNLIDPTTVTGPAVMIGAGPSAAVVQPLAASNRSLLLRLPRTLQPGAGSIAVDNGVGRFSPTLAVNPVRLGISAPARVRIGEQFNAQLSVQGLTAQNLQRPLTATVVVSGNATFPGNQREMRVPVREGVAQVPLVAHSAGAYEVRVTALTTGP